eukprot:15087248-Alexandrium_andersonii.AAC.1
MEVLECTHTEDRSNRNAFRTDRIDGTKTNAYEARQPASSVRSFNCADPISLKIGPRHSRG